MCPVARLADGHSRGRLDDRVTETNSPASRGAGRKGRGEMSHDPEYGIAGMINQLIGNGWHPVNKITWLHPDGKRLYRGPYKAYCVMLIERHGPLTEFPPRSDAEGEGG